MAISWLATARRAVIPPAGEVARIGAQIVAARAWPDLAGQLLHAAATAIEDVTHEQAQLHL